MALIEINHNPEARELFRFVALLPVAGLVFGAAVWFWTGSTVAAGSVAAVLAGLGVLGLLAPPLRRPLFLAWMYAFMPVGLVFGTILLAAMYFLVVTPVGVLVRVLRGDPLSRSWEQERRSYWVRRAQPPAAARYFRQY